MSAGRLQLGLSLAGRCTGSSLNLKALARYCKAWEGASVPVACILYAGKCPSLQHFTRIYVAKGNSSPSLGDSNGQSVTISDNLIRFQIFLTTHKEFVSLLGLLLVSEHCPGPGLTLYLLSRRRVSIRDSNAVIPPQVQVVARATSNLASYLTVTSAWLSSTSCAKPFVCTSGANDASKTIRRR